MNSIVKVELENNVHNLPEFNYLNHQETGGFLDDCSICDGGSSTIAEFDPFLEPWPLSVQCDDLPQLSLEDIEEITRSFDADHSSSFHQDNNKVDVGATPMMMATQPEFSHEQNTLVDANQIMTTQSPYSHQQNVFVDAMPVYATITHHEPQHFQTHYARPVYEMTSDEQPQHFLNHYFDISGNCEDVVVQNSMVFMEDYYDAPSQLDENVLVEAKPISMMLPSTEQYCLNNIPAANDFGNAMIKYEEGVVLRQHSRPRTSALELDEIRKYFKLPITRAAKELNVGLTVLKKRCRELNIMRWPHRKIKSLQCLIDNVKEMGMTDKREIEQLEEHKRMLERVPELELSESTKRLRQSCFKANYKKRRLMLLSSSIARP